MAEDASLESSSAVVDTSPQDSASPLDRKRKATEDNATLSSAHSKVVTNTTNIAIFVSTFYCFVSCMVCVFFNKKNAFWQPGLQGGQEHEGEEAQQGG